MSASPDRSLPASRFAKVHGAAFARTHWRLLLWFGTTSLVPIATTVATILLIRDFLAGVLSQPSGLAARLTDALGQTAALWAVVAALLAVFAIGALSMYASQVAKQRLIRLLELELMQKLIAHLLRLPVAYFDQRHRGDLVESIRQDVSKTRAAAAAAVEMVVCSAQAAAYAGSALLISPRLVLLSFPVLLLAAVPGRWFSARMRQRSVGARRHGYRLTDLLLQLFQGIRIVKVYAGEESETRNSIATARRYFDELIAAARVQALGGVILEAFGGLSMVAVIIVGGFEVMDGRLTVPELVAVLVAIRAVHGPLNNWFGHFMEIQRNWASFERLRELLQTEPDVRDRPDAVAFTGPIESIRFENVSFAYGSEPHVLRGVSFEIRAGQHVGVVGPSGAGKTTLMSLLARFYDPVAGRILLNGRDLRDYRLADVHRHLALVTQDPFVFGTTVRENIRYGSAAASVADVERVAAAAEIHEDILRLPEGYETVLGVGGRLLSAGQIQRLNVARALLKDASLVILDEATSNLDSLSETKLQLALERLMAGRTTFTIAHRLSTLRNADLILVLDQGRCVGLAPHEELLETCRLYRDLWEALQGSQPASGGATGPPRHGDHDLVLDRQEG
jgi:subfamily B ATP-binding cassette protein MsbA